MASRDKIHECATAALDYLRQAAMGLRMSGITGVAEELQPVMDHLREIIRENSRRRGDTGAVGADDEWRETPESPSTSGEAMSLEWLIDGRVGHRWSF